MFARVNCFLQKDFFLCSSGFTLKDGTLGVYSSMLNRGRRSFIIQKFFGYIDNVHELITICDRILTPPLFYQSRLSFLDYINPCFTKKIMFLFYFLIPKTLNRELQNITCYVIT